MNPIAYQHSLIDLSRKTSKRTDVLDPIRMLNCRTGIALRRTCSPVRAKCSPIRAKRNPMRAKRVRIFV